MKELNSKELFVAQEIINAGLINAAESLSFFMKEKITYDKLILCKDAVGTPCEISKKEETNVYLLTTEIIGELRGICYLIFSEGEALQLKKSALPAEIIANNALMEEMGDAVLLETDNIIAASVITQFSNFLKLKIYGGVPQLTKTTLCNLKEIIKTTSQKELLTINFKIIFKTSGMNFSPEFIWLFDDRFLNSIQDFCHNRVDIEKLKTN